jgi:hypothetical protein
VFACALGCTGPWSASSTEPLSVSHAAADSLANAPLITDQTITPATAVTTTPQPAPTAVPLTAEQEISLNNLVAEVRSTTPLDPAAEHKLRTELRAARQDEWSLVAKQFCSALAYSEQLIAREQKKLAAQMPASQFSAFPQPTVTQKATSPDAPPVPATIAEADKAPLSLPTTQVISDQANIPTDQSLPVRGTTLANHVSEPQATTTHQAVQQASHVVATDSGLSTPTNWQAQLDAAITAMQNEVKANPGSTDELQEHMRLRMLLLIAGRESDSLAPIPGASPTEQDYWSKQLFALSTYFDNSRQIDTKQRAAGALIHLDAARAKLAELATLQVRNLAFVDKVDGYGLYEPHEGTKFKPGDQVNLYAEVDSFRSESTKDGYRTTLATSYEVVDPQGRRVDGAQFPEVEDVCRNQRHDFHMQYGVALPTRIYPGEYELRLIITDQLSNKIGQASLPFEIVE